MHLLSIGFRRGKSNPCVYYNKERKLRTLVHGDDYASVGSLANLRWLKGQLEATFEMKSVICGHSDETDVVREAKILNRIIRASPEGWEYECDQRHAEIMIEAMGLEGTKKVTTPAAEESHKRTEEDEEEGRQPLDAESTTAFRALVARAHYILYLFISFLLMGLIYCT